VREEGGRKREWVERLYIEFETIFPKLEWLFRDRVLVLFVILEQGGSGSDEGAEGGRGRDPPLRSDRYRIFHSPGHHRRALDGCLWREIASSRFLLWLSC
jgi:hypothetical protein